MLALPIISQFGLYGKAREAYARKKKLGRDQDIAGALEESELAVTSKHVILIFWLSWIGVFVAVVGFALQIIGALISK